MKNPLFTILLLIVSITWLLVLFDRYYEINLADQVGLVFVGAIGLLLGTRLSISHKPYVPWTVSLGLSALLVTAPAITQWSISNQSSLWTWLYALAILTAFFSPKLNRAHLLTLIIACLGGFILESKFDPDQKKFSELMTRHDLTRIGEIHEVEWKDDKWIYYNQQLSYSEVDGHMYTEAFLFPVLHLQMPKSVLVLGGDNGLLIRELKRVNIQKINHLPFDYEYAVSSGTENHTEGDIHQFVSNVDDQYDLIIVDLPDPRNSQMREFYEESFFVQLTKKLNQGGMIVSQTGDIHDPASTFHQLSEWKIPFTSYHAQVPSIGQWSWAIIRPDTPADLTAAELMNIRQTIDSKWWNPEAMRMMLSDGNLAYFRDKRRILN